MLNIILILFEMRALGREEILRPLRHIGLDMIYRTPVRVEIIILCCAISVLTKSAFLLNAFF